jgi:hypothetical protein
MIVIWKLDNKFKMVGLTDNSHHVTFHLLLVTVFYFSGNASSVATRKSQNFFTVSIFTFSSGECG